MKAYKFNKNCLKIEADNCLIIITEKLIDTKGRPVTSIQVIPDKYVGERKNIRIGGCGNIRVISLFTKNK